LRTSSRLRLRSTSPDRTPPRPAPRPALGNSSRQTRSATHQTGSRSSQHVCVGARRTAIARSRDRVNPTVCSRASGTAAIGGRGGGVVERSRSPITPASTQPVRRRRRAASRGPPTSARPWTPTTRREENHTRVIPVSAAGDTHLSTGFSPWGSAGGRHSDKESSGTTRGSGFPTGFPLGAEAPRG
jgi:hypothetical protein